MAVLRLPVLCPVHLPAIALLYTKPLFYAFVLRPFVLTPHTVLRPPIFDVTLFGWFIRIYLVYLLTARYKIYDIIYDMI
jgi:hypothetical protein